MIKSLLQWYNALPKEMKLMLALAGLATPMGAIWFLKRWMFPGVSTFWIIVGVGAFIGLLSLISFLLSKGFSAGKRRRERKLAADLAQEAEAGSASMDVRATIKENTNKFFNAIREMRKTAGVSVYELPWYIVIGDSGCGKTKLINESGLTFSLGKPEGYQLGTLNYNWWFTEDAIFIDMAGRLCNPKDDSDYREWDSFLNTIAKGRKGYPINGAIVCISADHLLQDAPEKLEADATTALERLRDLQNKLGVTFATYLVVTKCDKILGFMQFFDRAAVDITIKNQIFGWSRPAGYETPFDPDSFDEGFNEIYRRLNELRIRRLNDEADELELGFAYTFPEEFRELKEPLKIYVRTLFPLIKNPRAVKNLLFRGVYFTSATQQGGLIVKHLAERLGDSAAEQLPLLENLYPRPRPHFVRELLFKKVFPEFGLVFRNEQQVQRNRGLARMVLVGGVATSLLLIFLLWFSATSFAKFIGEPRQRAKDVTAAEEKAQLSTADALRHAGAVSTDVDTLRRGDWSATLLSMGRGISGPANHLNAVRVSIFEQKLLMPALMDVEEALRTIKLPEASANDTKEQRESAERYLFALGGYLALAGAADAEKFPLDLSGDKVGQFKKLCAIVTKPDSVVKSPEFEALASAYFNTIREGNWRNPAKMFKTPEKFKPGETLKFAIQNVHRYYSGYARISDMNPNPALREWSRLSDQCAKMMAAYNSLLTAGAANIRESKGFDSFRTSFATESSAFIEAGDACTWKLSAQENLEPQKDFVRIPTLKSAVSRQREAWLAYQKQLEDNYKLGGPKSDNDAGLLMIRALSTGGDPAGVNGLDRELANSMQKKGLATREYFADFFSETTFPTVVRELDDDAVFGNVFKRVETPGQNDVLKFTDDHNLVRSVMELIRKQLEGAGGTTSGPTLTGGPPEWIAILETISKGGVTEFKLSISEEQLDKITHASWKKDQLKGIFSNFRTIVGRVQGTRILEEIEQRTRDAKDWGYAELYKDYATAENSNFTIPLPVSAAPPPAAPAPQPTAAAPKPAQPAATDDISAMFGSGQPAAPATPAAPAAAPVVPVTVSGVSQIPRAAKSQTILQYAWDCFKLRKALAALPPDTYLEAGNPGDRPRLAGDAINRAWVGYVRKYAVEWKTAYDAKNIPELDQLASVSGVRWPQFAQRLSPSAPGALNRAAIASALQNSLSEVLMATRWGLYEPRGRDTLDRANDALMRDIGGAYVEALRGAWGPNSFVVSAQDSTVQGVVPGDNIARQIADAFTQLCGAIEVGATLPTDFSRATPPAALGDIRWGVIQTLRSNGNLADEKLSAKLVEFEKRAKELLSLEISRVLVDIQTATLRGASASTGWPFTSTSETSTVPLADFINFLTQIDNARGAFERIEQQLGADDPEVLRRAPFYKACADWRAFLALGNNGNQPAPLGVTVWIDDPLAGGGGGQVDDTAQNYYNRVSLAVGLELDGGGAVIEFDSKDRKSQSKRAAWKWSPAGAGKFEFRLFQGIPALGQAQPMPEIDPRPLGQGGEFGFIAYLKAQARRDADGTWIADHAIDISNILKQRGMPAGKPRIGIRVRYQLDRPVPPAIPPFTAR